MNSTTLSQIGEKPLYLASRRSESMLRPPPEPPIAGTPVSWQTIFWTLVPLAINSMTQPGGRICGLPSRYRTYLRCSPFLCAADAFSIVSHLAVLCLYQKQRFLEAVGLILHERFNTADHAEGQQVVLHNDEDDGTGSVQSLEAMTWLRWLWFILGTLPPAIKLMSMSGVPWEQAWGMMFLASWIINESLIICAAINPLYFTFSRQGRISWPGFEQTALSSGYRNLRTTVTATRCLLAVSALAVHIVILNGIFRAVYRKWRLNCCLQSYGSGGIYSLTPYPDPCIAQRILRTSICMLGLGGILTFILRQLGYWRSGRNSALVLPFLNIFLVIFSVAIRESPTYALGAGTTHSAVYTFGLTTSGFVIIFSTLKFLVSRFVLLGKNLLITFPDGDESSPKLDHGGFLSLLLFLSTVLGAALWYGYIYDSHGTVNPSWTGIFG
jgi:hypothetical protein